MVASESPHDCCFGVASRLLLRSRLTTVASESPHDSSPLRGKSCAFGQTGLQPSPVFAPAGQRIRAVHTHLPSANACALNGTGGRQSLPMYDVRSTTYDVAKPVTRLRKIRNLSNQQPSMISPTPFAKAPQLPQARLTSFRPFGAALRAGQTVLQPPAVFPRQRRAIIQIVNRKSYIGASSASVVHGQPPSASAVSRSFVTTPVHGLTTSRSHALRIPAQRARIRKSYIVHRTSYIGRPRLPPSYIVHRT